MKTFYFRILIFLMLFFTTNVIVYGKNLEIIVQKEPLEPIDEDPIDNRAPARPMLCIIREDGVFIQDIGTDDIVSYEIYNTSKKCLLSTSGSLEFCSFVLSTSECIEIKLITYYCILKGYINF